MFTLIRGGIVYTQRHCYLALITYSTDDANTVTFFRNLMISVQACLFWINQEDSFSQSFCHCNCANHSFAERIIWAADTYQLHLNNLIGVPNEPPHAPTTLMEGEWVVDLTLDQKDTQEKHVLIPNQTELSAKRLSGEKVTTFLTDYQVKPYGVVLGYTFDQNTIPEAVELLGEVRLRMEDQSEILCTPSMNGTAGNTGKAMFQLQASIHPNQITVLLVGDVEIPL